MNMDMHRILVIHGPPHSIILYKKSKNSGLPGGSSMYVHCVVALVCTSTHGLHMVIIFCVWGEASAWICTVSWSYMHPHTLLLWKKNQKSLAAGWCEHVCALYRCPSVRHYAWVAYGDRFLHVGRGYSVDMYRILVIPALALARAMWITSTGSRIVCLWMAVAWKCPA